MPDSQTVFHEAGGKRNILIVEDEQINRMLLEMYLREEYALLQAENGEQALRMLAEERAGLSLVLLDLNLPDMNGMDILKRIKADPATEQLPVIVLTADQDAEVECLNGGAVDFIPKPYPPQQVVLARVRRTIELYEGRDTISRTERNQLTGLYNPTYFYYHAARFDALHPEVATDAIVLEIPHFHMIIERYGREVWSDVLKKVADALVKAVRGDGGMVCRPEGDRFLIYCPHRENYAALMDAVGGELGEDSHIRLRMGVYENTDRSLEMVRRFARAKRAADTARTTYGRVIGTYDSRLREKEVFEGQLLEGFRRAIREKQFQVFFQPKFDVRPQSPVLHSAEALVRWRHPELGMISPGVFIPLFEENGLIRDLDAYVWRETAERIRAWKETLGRRVPVSVNVSRVDLYDPSLLDTLRGIAAESGITRGEMFLEITESAYTDDADRIIEVVRQLRDSGFHIEMDDFGTGYSSLNMIADLPIDALKLDMSFVRRAFGEKKDTRLLEAIIGLARALALPTVAEGVETAEQAAALKAMGCDIIQGYYFSRPLPPAEFEDFLAKDDKAW